MKRLGLLCLAALALGSIPAGAAPNTDSVPTRTVVVAGGQVVVADPTWHQTGGPLPAPPAAPALAPASGPVLFAADFAKPDTSAWTSPLVPQADQPAAWAVRDGALVQAGLANTATAPEEAYALAGDPTWRDMTLEAAVLASSGEGTGFVWRVSDKGFYRVQLQPALPVSAPRAVLERVQGGIVTLLAAAPVAAYAGYQPGVWQTLRVTSSGDRQQVWVNGSPLFDVTDSVLTAGQIGLYAWADSAARFDNVRVQTGPVPAPTPIQSQPASSPPANADADQATAVTFAAPKKASDSTNGVGRLAAAADGSVNILAVYGNSITVESDSGFYGTFATATLDSSTSGIGNPVPRHRPDGKIVADWYHGFSDGTNQINRGLKSPGPAGSGWTTGMILGSTTGPATNGGFKVTDLAVQQGSNRVYALWARNNVGARLAYSDDGVNWSAPIVLPGPVSGTAADFALGVARDGTVAVAWFERENTDLLVQMRSPAGTWGPVTDIAPVAGQAYGARFAADAQGGLRIIWDQVDPATQAETDVWYREWTPTGGWSGALVQLYRTTADSTPGRGYNIAVDPSGVAYIVFSETVNGNPQQTYYLQGRGTSFTAPQNVLPQFAAAANRYPDIDLNTVNGGLVAHIVTNSNADGQFANYYTYTTLGTVPPPTPAPAPTPCGSNFSDVPATSPYYAAVKDLVARGAISGYSDCTFRPANAITRGQVAKVLVLGMGWAVSNPAAGHFSDVPPGSTFYPYVETAYAHGAVSGYSDGTYRPSRAVTRAQLTKMATLARGWALARPATPTFRDVPPTDAFYPYVETAVDHGIIGGYSDGTFHPGSAATRGQSAKVIDLAITTR